MNSDRILVRGVNWLGDAVMSTPALLRLREACPAARITLLTAEKLADLWYGHPALDEVITFRKSDGIRALSRRLRASRFDRALILPNSFRSAFEGWLAGIPRRIGFAGSGRRMLLTQVVPRRSEHLPMRKRGSGEIRRLLKDEPGRPRERFPISGHHLHNYLHLVSALGGNPAPVAPHLQVAAQELADFRAKHSIPGNHRVIGINPGAEYGPAKRWPARSFILAAALSTAASLKPAEESSNGNRPICWIITGAAADTNLAAEIEAGIRQNDPASPILNLAGRTKLRELCVALAACETVLTNDTGPMHLAAAVGTRVIAPFGSTSPELTGPGLPGDPRHHLVLGQAPCAPCFRRVCPVDFRCMRSIQPEAMAGVLRKIVQEEL